MFQSIKNPEAEYRVPGWLWDLCWQLNRSSDPLKRAAAAGLLINRVIQEDADGTVYKRVETRFESWVRSLTSEDLDELECAIALKTCRLRPWLHSLVKLRFPEEDLVAFACEREILQAATCALEWCDRDYGILEDLNVLDQDVVATIETYVRPRAHERERIFVRRRIGLLELAKDRDDTAWWSQLAKPLRKRRKRRL